jgi:DNA-binding HxlR family transcriptional regulator
MDLHPDRCPVELTVSVMGGKWKPTILYNLVDGPKRFNELRRLLPDVTQRMLTLQLRALEEDGVVARTDHGEVPPRVDYALTEYGWTLAPIIEAMVDWGERHKACGKAEAV